MVTIPNKPPPSRGIRPNCSKGKKRSSRKTAQMAVINSAIETASSFILFYERVFS